MNWKTLLKLILPLIRMAGEAKKAEDSNTTGKDDAVGVSMVYGCDLFEAIVSDKALPKAPKELR